MPSPPQGVRRKVEHILFAGMPISLEYRKGDTRSGKNAQGKQWFRKMTADYGYIRGTEGTDGDHVDVYIGPKKDSQNVYRVNQLSGPDFKKFDEQKFMLGYDTLEAAKVAYLSHYPDARILGSIKSVPLVTFMKKVFDKKFHGKKVASKGKEPSRANLVARGAGISSTLTMMGLGTKDFVSRRRVYLPKRVAAIAAGAIPGALVGGLYYEAKKRKERQSKKVAGAKGVATTAALLAGGALAGGAVIVRANYATLPKKQQQQISREIRDPRLYSNLRGAFTSREKRVAAHKLLNRRKDHTVLSAMKEGFTRGGKEAQFLVNPNDPLHTPPTERKKRRKNAHLEAALPQVQSYVEMKLAGLDPDPADIFIVKQANVKQANMKRETIAERIDDVGIGILAAPYAAELVGKLRTRKGVLGGVGRGATSAAKWMERHETPLELTGLSLVAPGVTNTLAKGVDKARTKIKEMRSKRAQLDALMETAYPDYEYLTEMEKQAILGKALNWAGRAVGGLARGVRAGAGATGRAGVGVLTLGRNAAIAGKARLGVQLQSGLRGRALQPAVAARVGQNAVGRAAQTRGARAALKGPTSSAEKAWGTQLSAANTNLSARTMISRKAAPVRVAPTTTPPVATPPVVAKPPVATTVPVASAAPAPAPVAAPPVAAAPTKTVVAKPPATTPTPAAKTPVASDPATTTTKGKSKSTGKNKDPKTKGDKEKKPMSGKMKALIGTGLAGTAGAAYVGKGIVDSTVNLTAPRNERPWGWSPVSGRGRVF